MIKRAFIRGRSSPRKGHCGSHCYGLASVRVPYAEGGWEEVHKPTQNDDRPWKDSKVADSRHPSMVQRLLPPEQIGDRVYPDRHRSLTGRRESRRPWGLGDLEFFLPRVARRQQRIHKQAKAPKRTHRMPIPTIIVKVRWVS